MPRISQTITIGEFGDITHQRCCTCKKVLDLEEFACDRRNKTTGRQRQCRGCFKSYYVRRMIGKRRVKDKMIRVPLAGHVREWVRVTSLARGMSIEEYVGYVVTMWAEGDWDSQYEHAVETEARATLSGSECEVEEEDYITIEDRVKALLAEVKE